MGQVADFEINKMLEPAHKNIGDGEVVAIRAKLTTLPVQTIILCTLNYFDDLLSRHGFIATHGQRSSFLTFRVH